jgi:hypothetical protein
VVPVGLIRWEALVEMMEMVLEVCTLLMSNLIVTLLQDPHLQDQLLGYLRIVAFVPHIVDTRLIKLVLLVIAKGEEIVIPCLTCLNGKMASY